MMSTLENESTVAVHSLAAADIAAARRVLAAHNKEVRHEAVKRAWIFGSAEETAKHFDDTAAGLHHIADGLRRGRFPPYREQEENYVAYSHIAIESLAHLRDEYPDAPDADLFATSQPVASL